MMNIMRYPEGHKQAVRERIVRNAASALRRHGISGIGIPALMKRAGLTHGGFYAHFRNRDDLVAEAVRSAADDTARRVFADDAALDAALGAYLSRAHVEHPERGCVLAALGTDAVRQRAPVRRAFADAARGFLRLVQRKEHPDRPDTGPDDDALRRAASMVGAVVLARVVDDPSLSERILRSVREA